MFHDYGQINHSFSFSSEFFKPNCDDCGKKKRGYEIYSKYVKRTINQLIFHDLIVNGYYLVTGDQVERTKWANIRGEK